MRILIEPGDYEWFNLGDVAMAQVAVRRLRKLWPQAQLAVVTYKEDRLRRYCPGTAAVPASGQARWLSEESVFGGRGYARLLPPALRAPAIRFEAGLRHRWPRQAYHAVRLAERSGLLRPGPLTAFGRALLGTDLLVISGAGDLNSTFESNALKLLRMLQSARAVGARTVLFGQGIGPIHTPRLLAQAKAVLPHVDLIALREKRKGPALLGEIGVDRQRVIVTGDDAIELAYENRTAEGGRGIGVNLRYASYAAIGQDLQATVRPIVHEAARRYGAPLVPTPLRVAGTEADIEPIRHLLDGHPAVAPGWEAIDDPAGVIRQVGRCRVVVTSSYHPAVFALAQGIPAVAIARSEYYADKFLGLADSFGGGCECVDPSAGGFAERLARAIDRAWSTADGIRSSLLTAAADCTAAGRAAYRRCFELVEDRRPVGPGDDQIPSGEYCLDRRRGPRLAANR